ncbi:hypothetical protein L4C36_05620 [Photobacterium japonica]|uniref:hypothetical protein n=1 Tax=Photobacterium japonica TaxID=2910235 RepID=UPI003D0C9C7A
MTYKTWVFISEETRTFFITTHVAFDGMTTREIQTDIPTWERPDDHKKELMTLASAYDFRVVLDRVSHVDDLRTIKARYVAQGFRCLNRRIVLRKNNQNV